MKTLKLNVFNFLIKSKKTTAPLVLLWPTFSYILSQVKSALRKLSEGKDHHCDSFMSDVSVLYKFCVSNLAKWTILFAEFKCFN